MKINIKNIIIVVTARTSYCKMKSLIISLKSKKNIKLNIICATSAVSDNYGNIEKYLKKDKIKIDYKINNLLDDKTLNSSTKTVALGIIQFADLFKIIKPDLVVIMADRYEVIAPAIASSYQNIPLAHVQGGEISGNIDEKVRHALTKFADVHFPATVNASKNIIRMGENKNNVFHTGCPSIDLAKKIKNKKRFSFNIYNKYMGVGAKFKYLSKNYLIVMFHPDTNEVSKTNLFTQYLLKIIIGLNTNTFWFWPNSDAGTQIISKIIRQNREMKKLEKIHFFKNMEPEDFLILLNNSKGIIGNSSAGIRESSYFGVPSVNLGSRQLGRETSKNVLNINNLSLNNIKSIKNHLNKKFNPSHLYGKGDAGKQIASILSKKNFSYKKTFI